MYSPIRQCLQDGGHQDPRDGLVEDGVTNAHYVHHCGGAEDGQHVGRHALPEVQQEALDLKPPHTPRYSASQEIKGQQRTIKLFAGTL